MEDPGLVIHFRKHLSVTFCKVKKKFNYKTLKCHWCLLAVCKNASTNGNFAIFVQLFRYLSDIYLLHFYALCFMLTLMVQTCRDAQMSEGGQKVAQNVKLR